MTPERLDELERQPKTESGMAMLLLAVPELIATVREQQRRIEELEEHLRCERLQSEHLLADLRRAEGSGP